MHSRRSVRQKCLPILKQTLAVFVAAQLLIPAPVKAQGDGSNDDKTTSPIKHVIIIVGENRTFDHIFATYVPKAGQHVDNLLSKQIVLSQNVNKNAVFQAVDRLRITHGSLRVRAGLAV
jgi:phospholipase C